MSFRLRALLLVVIVAVTATTATAWLVLRQATGQVRDSVTASQQQAKEITASLREYGAAHATWAGIEDTVVALSSRSDQRIRVETTGGALLADSDLLAGHPARRVVGVPLLVDARPSLTLPELESATTLARLTIGAIAQYRRDAAYAACLTRAGVPVLVTTGSDGVPRYQAESTGGPCSPDGSPAAALPTESEAAFSCAQKPTEAWHPCLTQLFDRAVAATAPDLLRVFIGAEGQAVPAPRAGPTILAALAVAAAAMLGALMLSRSVLRPVRALMAAAQDIGRGDRAGRVRVSGRDEIAQLGSAFNTMADALAAAEESQRRMTADIAHELRSPLANLRGYLEAMRDGVLTPTPELLESLHEEVLLQQRVVDDLQDLALAESSQLTYHRRPLEIGAVVQACASAHASAADAAQVQLVLEPEVGAPVLVNGDPDRLRQVIGNLVGNAVRATPPGGRVILRIRRDDPDVAIEVVDTGIGIATADLAHVFDRFWRADPARGRGTGGAGLGLAIAKQIIADHRGTIDVVSAPGQGTTFTIRLPAEISG